MMRIIVADIDCTLVDKGKEMLPEVKEALDRLLKDDYLVGLASGRHVGAVEDNWKKWGLNRQFDFIIGMNGAMIKDENTGENVSYGLMDFDQVSYIFDHFSPLKATANVYCDDDVNYVYKYDPDDDVMEGSYKRDINYKWKEIASLEPLSKVKTYRVLYRVKKERMPEILEFVEKHPVDEAYDSFRTDPTCYEIMLKGISKGKALVDYCKRKGISLDDTYAFGDTSNDVEMIRVCHGVCLCNGSDDAKKAAEYITEYPCDQAGFAKFVNKYFYNEK